MLAGGGQGGQVRRMRVPWRVVDGVGPRGIQGDQENMLGRRALKKKQKKSQGQQGEHQPGQSFFHFAKAERITANTVAKS